METTSLVLEAPEAVPPSTAGTASVSQPAEPAGEVDPAEDLSIDGMCGVC